MKYIKKILVLIFRIIFKFKAKPAIKNLLSSPDFEIRLIGQVLNESLKNIRTNKEKDLLDKIESLRTRLDNSKDKINVNDYGVIKSGQMIHGEKIDYGISYERIVGQASKSTSQPYFWAFFLFKIIRNFKPMNCLELGTFMGISTSYIGTALNLNGGGKIKTLEGADSLAFISKKNFNELGLNNIEIIVGRFQNTLDKVLNQFKPFNFVFIDGHHDEKATLKYFEQIIPSLSPNAVIVFDDISWSKGMKKAWKLVESDTRVNISINFRKLGVCILDRENTYKKTFKIPLY